MAVSQTKLNEEIRQKVMEEIKNFYGDREELLRVASNKFAYPTVDSENDDKWVIITVTVPKSDYDGYTDADFYKEKCEDKKIKEAERKAKNAEKAKKDAERRAKLKAKKENGD